MRAISIVLLLLFTTLSIGVFAQKEVKIDLEWNENPLLVVTETSTSYFPNVKDAFISESEFLFIKEFKRASLATQMDFEMISYQTTSLDKTTKEYLEVSRVEIAENVWFKSSNVSERGRPVTILSLQPLVRVNGEIRRITSITFNQVYSSNYSLKTHSFTTESVLNEGSGDWYKISVKRDGIVKVDYEFLKSIGVNMNGLNPAHIHIYGNGTGRLPEHNNVYRPDDLLKNDIYVKGEDDGVFNTNDYILFYAKGPHKWEEKNGRFERLLNIYSEESVYFININPNTTLARVQTAPMVSGSTTHVVTDFSNYTIHEKELINIMRTGQRWYGETFDATLSQNFSLQIPNLNPNEPAILRVAGGAELGSNGGTTNFTVKYGSTTLGKATLPKANSDSKTRGVFLSEPNVFKPTSNSFTLNVTFNRVTPSDVGYLDFLEVNARSYLRYLNGLHFRDLNSVGVGNIAEFQLTNTHTNAQVWEISNPTQPKLVQGSLSGSTFTFKAETDSLKNYIAFHGSDFSTPKFEKKIRHQNLHGLVYADYLIVTHPLFLGQANRLADLHREKGLAVHVVTTEQVYNEFSSGSQDPTAIRYFAKMFYDRANGDQSLMPKYLLLFGDGTYDPLDRVPDNNYMVPMYETLDSETYTGSIVSDDYFGFLDDNESFTPSDILDIGIGRLIATTESDAVNLVNKIEHYMKNGSYLYASENLACGEDGYISTHGDWRLKYTVIADDEDNGRFVSQDLEPATNYVDQNHPEMNVKKIYADSYQQITTAGGERYPEVNEEIARSIGSGSLVTCFVGHGSPSSAMAERVMTISDVRKHENIDKLTLFVSATCEFARVDDNTRVSIGELMALNKKGGAIALMTTTRAVFVTTNSKTTNRFFENVFQMDADGKPRTFGDIITDTKNQVTDNINNKRSFMLLGDPALRIALPYEKAVLDSINDVDIALAQDTIRALSHVRMKGHIQDQYGNKLTYFNGVIQPSIYDKVSDRQTLGQDANSPVIDFQEQVNVLFKGKATVENGEFAYEFIVPKDIDYSFGPGKVSMYAWNDNNSNAGGYTKELIIGGIDTTGLNDQEGPQIELYLNNEDFVNGGITNETPILIANLYDESGINTVGNGIGHDITLIIDDETSEAIVLNDYYESDLDTYKSGTLRYQLTKLRPGLHTLTFKAWDVNNNSSERRIEFNVQEKREMALDHVLNYPNPFTTHTEFFFEHNQVCSSLEAQIEIFTVTGRLVKTINQVVETSGFRSKGIAWDGRDEFGDQLAKGVYVYRVTVENPDGEKTQEMQKLYLLR